jgi:hypothetical protein
MQVGQRVVYVGPMEHNGAPMVVEKVKTVGRCASMTRRCAPVAGYARRWYAVRHLGAHGANGVTAAGRRP